MWWCSIKNSTKLSNKRLLKDFLKKNDDDRSQNLLKRQTFFFLSAYIIFLKEMMYVGEQKRI